MTEETPEPTTADLPDDLAARVEAHVAKLTVLNNRCVKEADAYEQAAQAAYPDFKAARMKGVLRVEAKLGGQRAALFSLIAGGKDVKVDEDLLLMLIAVASPSDVEDYVLPAAFADDRVVKLIAGQFPEFVAARIKKTIRAELQKQIEMTGGSIAVPGTGEIEKVAVVTPIDPSGRFQLRPEKRAQQLVTAAIEAGQITADGITVPVPEVSRGLTRQRRMLHSST